uniref:Uncharacterized protein n=1 Tax=Chelydra serpentina TaxID=8475 RepID=A0A8C3SEB3_CHESE
MLLTGDIFKPFYCISTPVTVTDRSISPHKGHADPVSSTGHPIDIAHSSLELLSAPPTTASQAAGITGTRHHTRLVAEFLLLLFRDPDLVPVHKH